jgi:hypothetical protein
MVRTRIIRSRPRLQLAVVITSMALLASAACESNSGSSAAKPSKSSSSPGLSEVAAGPPYRPNIDPSNFVRRVDNPLFPLIPGTTYKLRGETPGGIEHETVEVTSRTKSILGVTATVVKDVIKMKGQVAESTFDWYAQDRDGNVWYFGEDTAEYENGKVTSREGSWEAGVKGAQPGIIMNASPQLTDSFRQEYQKGVAEDMYWVVATNDSIKAAGRQLHNIVRTIEWNPLEPTVVDEKFYAPGLGLVSERALAGGKETITLLKVIRP